MKKRILTIITLIVTVTLFIPITDCQASKKKSKAAERADIHRKIGADYFKRGDYLAALKELTKSVEFNKKDPDSQYLLGTIYFQLKRYPDAEEHLKVALALKKNDPEGFPQAHNNLGNVYLAMGRYDEAIEQFEACLEYIFYQPSFPQTYTNLGISYTKKGDNEKAMESFKIAIKLAPKYCPARLNLGHLYGKLEKHNEAIIEYQKVVNTCGGTVISDRARLYMGVELNTSGRRSEACEQFFAVLTDSENTEIAAQAGEYVRLLQCK